MSGARASGLSVDALLERLTERDLALLADLEQLRLASTRHLQRLHFTTSAHTTAQAATRACIRVLTRLLHLGMVTRLARRVGGVRAGSAGFVWQLGPAGERLLRAMRGEPGRRRYHEPSPLFQHHTLAITELAVTLRERAAARPDILELEVLTEPACWQPFTGPHGRAETLKPDLLVRVTTEVYVEHTLVEIDRSTEHLPAILRKAYTYQRYAATGTYQQRHELFPAVLWVVPTPQRADALRRALTGEQALDPALFAVTTSALVADQLLGEPGALEPSTATGTGESSPDKSVADHPPPREGARPAAGPITTINEAERRTP